MMISESTKQLRNLGLPCYNVAIAIYGFYCDAHGRRICRHTYIKKPTVHMVRNIHTIQGPEMIRNLFLLLQIYLVIQQKTCKHILRNYSYVASFTDISYGYSQFLFRLQLQMIRQFLKPTLPTLNAVGLHNREGQKELKYRRKSGFIFQCRYIAIPIPIQCLATSVEICLYIAIRMQSCIANYSHSNICMDPGQLN